MSGPLLEVSAPEGARLVALRYLEQASAAADRLHDADDDEALHDFRVAIRRLRSCLRAYRELLSASVGKKARRRLRAIAKRTNPGRDAEVQLGWVRAEGDVERARTAPGVRWLEAQLDAQTCAAYEQIREDLHARFLKVESELRARLASYEVRFVVGEPDPRPRFARVAAEAMRAQLDVLVSDLREVKKTGDEALAHDARIHGKRLRYLLEPFRGELDGAKGAVKSLKQLQDLLGDLNDLHNLTATVGQALEETALSRARSLRKAAMNGAMESALEKDERPGLLALLEKIQADRAARMERLKHEWLAEGGRLDALRDEVSGLLGALEEEQDVEIERKYLLNALPPACRAYPAVDIDQGYLPGEKLVERVRRKRTTDGATFVRTVKHGEGVKRIELEEECSDTVFSTLWSLTEGRRLRKRRYVIPAGELEWEVDEFTDRALVLAEIELPTEDAEVELPDWLAPYVERDVTGDPTYLNMNLAR